jgi:hypothetical protein
MASALLSEQIEVVIKVSCANIVMLARAARKLPCECALDVCERRLVSQKGQA